MLFTHAQIHTMAGPALADGWLRVADGKIAALGPMPAPEGDPEIYDCNGMRMYPGFVDAHTHLGMWEDGLGFEGADGNEETDPVTPQLRAIDGINPMDRGFAEALAAGITTVVTGPGSANAIGGQLAAVKTYGPCVDDRIVKAPLAIKMALGENPKSVYHDQERTPMTRMATAALIREELFKARRYADDLARSEAEEDVDPPEFDMKAEALLPALRREVQVHFHAHRADDIFTAVRIAREFYHYFLIVHCTEGYLVADRLQKAGVRALCGPLLTDRSKPELRAQTPACPAVLSRAGVPVAIITDHPETPAQYLPLCAGLAVQAGLPEEEALRAITIEPARICEIADRVGSLEVGKDADFALFPGSPLWNFAKPSLVVAGGEIAVEQGEGGNRI